MPTLRRRRPRLHVHPCHAQPGAGRVRRFAERWGMMRRVEVRPGMRQRIYQLEVVTPPTSVPPGRLRGATSDALIASRTGCGLHRRGGRFRLRATAAGRGPHRAAEPLFLGNGRPGVDGRVGSVYTPPEYRRRGYAVACVAALSQHLLVRARGSASSTPTAPTRPPTASTGASATGPSAPSWTSTSRRRTSDPNA